NLKGKWLGGIRADCGYHIPLDCQSRKLPAETAADPGTGGKSTKAGESMKQTQLTSDISIRRTVAEDNAEQLAAVKEIIRNVRLNGDAALLEYTEKWDGVKLVAIQVGPDEMKEAVDRFDPQLLQDLSEAAGNIRDYHENQKQQ